MINMRNEFNLIFGSDMRNISKNSFKWQGYVVNKVGHIPNEYFDYFFPEDTS